MDLILRAVCMVLIDNRTAKGIFLIPSLPTGERARVRGKKIF
jgi:hypothetical protein